MPEDDARKFLRIPIWKWSLLSSVVTVLGVFGGLIGVVQYTQTVEAKRAEKTLELIDKWTKEGYRAGFLRLRDRTFDVLQNQSGPDSEKVTPNAGPNLRAYIVREVSGSNAPCWVEAQRLGKHQPQHETLGSGLLISVALHDRRLRKRRGDMSNPFRLPNAQMARLALFFPKSHEKPRLMTSMC